MDIDFNPKRHTKICNKIRKDHCLDTTKCMLGFVNRAINTGLYMIDYREKKLIIGNLPGHVVAGLPVEMFNKRGIKVYENILSKDEIKWADEVYAQAQKVFDLYDDHETRMEIVFSYDLASVTPKGRQITLRHRVVPYQLDEDGYMWLAMCAVSTSPLTHKVTKACIDCIKTGERYDYIDNKFVLSQHKYLTEEEITILGYLADGMAMKQISAVMDLSLRAVERKKKDALEKLGAATQAAAVYKAKGMGLI